MSHVFRFLVSDVWLVSHLSLPEFGWRAAAPENTEHGTDSRPRCVHEKDLHNLFPCHRQQLASTPFESFLPVLATRPCDHATRLFVSNSLDVGSMNQPFPS